MGGRGPAAVDKNNIWYRLPLSVLGVSEIMGHEILYNDSSPNEKIALRILEENGIKLFSDESGKIGSIVEFVNHKAVFQIDLDNNAGPHGHKVDENGRVSHDPSNFFKVPDRYTDLVDASAEHNWKFFRKRLPSVRIKNLKEIDIEELLSKRKNGK